MGLPEMLNKIKKHQDFNKVGMLLCHNGVVRGFSRDGQPVTRIKVEANFERLNELLKEMKSRPGIIDISVEIKEGDLSIGDDIMYVVVAGDIRDNVFPVLKELVDKIKKEVTKKKEDFAYW